MTGKLQTDGMPATHSTDMMPRAKHDSDLMMDTHSSSAPMVDQPALTSHFLLLTPFEDFPWVQEENGALCRLVLGRNNNVIVDIRHGLYQSNGEEHKYQLSLRNREGKIQNFPPQLSGNGLKTLYAKDDVALNYLLSELVLNRDLTFEPQTTARQRRQ